MTCTTCVERLRREAIEAERLYRDEPIKLHLKIWRNAWDRYYEAKDELERADIERRYPLTEVAS